jgi:hypothetical protein
VAFAIGLGIYPEAMFSLTREPTVALTKSMEQGYQVLHQPAPQAVSALQK